MILEQRDNRCWPIISRLKQRERKKIRKKRVERKREEKGKRKETEEEERCPAFDFSRKEK